MGRCGSFWVRCGSFWVRCGSLWMAVGRFGWFLVLVTNNLEVYARVSLA